MLPKSTVVQDYPPTAPLAGVQWIVNFMDDDPVQAMKVGRCWLSIHPSELIASVKVDYFPR
jgi:hypothetical protein